MPRPLTATFRAFLAGEAAGGIVLIAAAALALLIANSPLAAPYAAFLDRTTGPVLAPATGPMTVRLWIDDGAMAAFFLLVGLEVKRELLVGELADAAARRLPILAAAAGMAVPALLYLAVTRDHPELRGGWAIPAATDIAFALGIMALLGPRVPPSLKLFLATVAIADDIGAVAIIALFYSHGLDLGALAAAAGVLAVMAAMNRRGVAGLPPYLLAGVLLWWLVLRSGVHATVAGVLVAAVVPMRDDAGASPLHRLEHALSPWVAFAIVPLFALANAGVSFVGTGLRALAEPLVIAIAVGLFLGKQIGIMGAVALADRLGIARRPEGAGWRAVYGATLLAGIGFTMSLFIGGLAFPGDPARIDAVRIGVLGGSILSALAGYAVLRFAGGRT